MNVVGIDFSLTSTGVCAITDGEAECITVKTKKEESWWEFPERVAGIARDVAAWVGEDDPVLVIESPSFGSKSAALDKMFGGWWLFINALRHQGSDVPFKVAPTQVKKWATGRGNAGKDEVLAAVIRKHPDVHITGNDQADALTLAAIGAAVMGEPFTGTLTKYQQEIVDALRATETEKNK